MKIFIIGGTRFIGREVVHQLHSLGHSITVFHRGQTEGNLPDEVQHILGNRLHFSCYAAEVRAIEPDVVLDMIPITERDADSLISTFQDASTRIVAISSQDVYRAYGVLIGIEPGPAETIPFYEDSPLRETHFPYRGDTRRKEDDPRKYLDDYEKILVERKIMENPHHPGTILRLPMVYGPRDYQHRFFQYIKRMEDQRPAIFLHGDLARWRTTQGYVKNVARAITLAVLDGRAAGKTYNVGDFEAMSTFEWVTKIGKVVGWQGQVVALENVPLPTYLIPGFNTKQHMIAECSSIREELGFREIVELQTAIEETYRWEVKNPPENLDPNQFDYQAEDNLFKVIQEK